jgi:very-long-chain (3R)-3-hydroxyacyl-CoA dehydratase
MGLLSLYLGLFNAASCGLWAYAAFLGVRHLVDGGSIETTHESVGPWLYHAQGMALFELVHSLTRMVKSPFMSTLMQVSSRILLAFFIARLVPEVLSQWGFPLMMFSWCAVEIPRYGFFAWKELFGSVPYPLLWLRYSLFGILYPTGITGELTCMYTALPYIASRDILRLAMPNDYNFAFNYYYVVVFIMILYIPGSPFMYNHMRAQRRKQLGPQKKPAAESTKGSTGKKKSSKKTK